MFIRVHPWFLFLHPLVLTCPIHFPTMARPSTEHYDLSETEKRDLIKLIEQGKPLPEKYRFMLFADKREVELVWNGKTREVCTAVLPF